MANCPACGAALLVRPVEIVIPWRAGCGPLRAGGRDVQEVYCPACGYSALTQRAREAVRMALTEAHDFDAERASGWWMHAYPGPG